MDWVNVISVFADVAIAGVAVAGLIWAVIKFRTREEHLPRIQFDITAKVIDIHNDHAVVIIEPSIDNKGNVPLNIGHFETNVFGFLAHDSFIPYVEEGLNNLNKESRLRLHHLIHSQNMMGKNCKCIIVRPNTLQVYNIMISIPITMRYIRVYSEFFEDDKEKRVLYTKAVAIKIEAPQGESEK